MNSGAFNVLVFGIFFILILVVAIVLLVPIKNGKACVRYCIEEGFIGGFCSEVTRGSIGIYEIESKENATLTDAQCLWNPLSKDMVTYVGCFCRK